MGRGGRTGAECLGPAFPSMPAPGWPEHFYWKKDGVKNSRGRKVLSAGKAAEMLDSPPGGTPLTTKQTRFFQAVKHGMTPRKRG